MATRTDFTRMDRATVTRLREATALLVGARGRLDERAGEVPAYLAGLPGAVIADYWNAERVLPLAGRRAAEIELIDNGWREFVSLASAAARDSAAVQDLVSRQLTKALARSGIETVVLKGPPMGRQLFGDYGTRQQSGDIDLLLPADQLWEASTIVQTLGWLPPADSIRGGGLPWHHLTHASPGTAPDIELHWRVHWYDVVAEHSAGVLRRATTDSVSGLRVPAPTDVLINLLLGFVRDGVHRLRLAADIAAWWDVFGDAHVNEAELAMASGGLLRPLRLAALGATVVVGTPPPTSYEPGRRSRLVSRVASGDWPMPERAFVTQATMIDLAAAPSALGRERWAHAWFRDESQSRQRRPLVPPIVAVPLRAARVAAAATAALRRT